MGVKKFVFEDCATSGADEDRNEREGVTYDDCWGVLKPEFGFGGIRAQRYPQACGQAGTTRWDALERDKNTSHKGDVT